MSTATHPQQITPWEETTSSSVRNFLQTESGSAGLLLAATLVALVWANSPLSGLYEDLWGTHLRSTWAARSSTRTCATGSTTA